MKFQLIKAALLLIVSFSSSLLNAQNYSKPESVIWDEINKQYLITNTNNHVNGFILTYDPETEELGNFINTGLDSPKGMTIVDGIIYVTDVTKVKGYNLKDKTQIMNLTISGATWLNDITNDKSGNLFVGGMDTGIIYKIVISSEDVSSFINTSSPNGLLYEEQNNRILVCSWGNNAKIKSIDLTNSTITTILNTSFSNLDGIVSDNCGNYYISSWGANAVYRYENNFENRLMVWVGLDGPADIYFDQNSHELVMPNFNSSTVMFKSFFQLCLKPSLVSPENNATNQAVSSTFLDWENFPGVGDYEYGYTTDSAFITDITSAITNTSEVTISDLNFNTKYYWRVKARSSQGQSEWSEIYSFTTEPSAGITEFGKEGLNFLISPNPAVDIITVKSRTSFSSLQYDIIDLAGRNIKSGLLDIKSINTTINISDLKKGFYIIRIEEDNKQIHQQKLLIYK